LDVVRLQALLRAIATSAGTALGVTGIEVHRGALLDSAADAALAEALLDSAADAALAEALLDSAAE
jgi:hypothetical protein